MTKAKFSIGDVVQFRPTRRFRGWTPFYEKEGIPRNYVGLVTGVMVRDENVFVYVDGNRGGWDEGLFRHTSRTPSILRELGPTPLRVGDRVRFTPDAETVTRAARWESRSWQWLGVCPGDERQILSVLADRILFVEGASCGFPWTCFTHVESS